MKNRYVLDVNILFSGILSQKEIYRKMFSENIFYTPDFALIELDKYNEVILKKTKFSQEKIRDFTLFLFSKIIVVPDYIISDFAYNNAKELCNDIDIKDTVYIALNEELQTEFLTRDKILRDGLLSKRYTRVILFDEFIQNLIK